MLSPIFAQWTEGSRARWCKGLFSTQADAVGVVYDVLEGRHTRLQVRRALEADGWDYDRATRELSVVSVHRPDAPWPQVKPPHAACPVASPRLVQVACFLPLRLIPHTPTPGQQEPVAEASASARAGKRSPGGGAEAGTGDAATGHVPKRVKTGPATATKPLTKPRGERYVHGSSC
jgi:hypothetical protein